MCFFDYVLPPYQWHMPRFSTSLIMFIQFEAKYNLGTTFTCLSHCTQRISMKKFPYFLKKYYLTSFKYPVTRGADGAATLQVSACTVFLIYVISNRKLRLRDIHKLRNSILNLVKIWLVFKNKHAHIHTYKIYFINLHVSFLGRKVH